MATIVNNPPNNSGNGMGFLLGVIILVVFGAVFFIYILPLIQQGMNGGVQVNIPKDINVKVEESK